MLLRRGAGMWAAGPPSSRTPGSLPGALHPGVPRGVLMEVPWVGVSTAPTLPHRRALTSALVPAGVPRAAWSLLFLNY